MSYAYQVCPDCYGMIKADTMEKMPQVQVTNNIASQVKAKLKERVESEDLPKSFGLKGGDSSYALKRSEAVKYFNELKKHQKAGKLNPSNLTEDQLWAYAIKAKGLID